MHVLGNCVLYLDVDECLERLDTCEHECVNTVGGYRCDCRPGYRRISRSKCAGARIKRLTWRRGTARRSVI